MSSWQKAGTGGDGGREWDDATDAYTLYALHGGERPEGMGEDGRGKGFGTWWWFRVIVIVSAWPLVFVSDLLRVSVYLLCRLFLLSTLGSQWGADHGGWSAA
jgi:hypothetical protein